MTEPINLRQARKAQARRDKEAAAGEARAKHGQTKAEKTLRAAREAKSMRDLAAHKRND